MKLLKSFNLNATKALIVISIIVILLWVLPYAVPSDPSAIGANPTGWGIFAVFIWGLYCAFAATEYRSLRGLGMRPRQWLSSMHATLWLAALILEPSPGPLTTSRCNRVRTRILRGQSPPAQ